MGPRVITVPVAQKTADGQVVQTKTIRLTGSQLSNFKFISQNQVKTEPVQSANSITQNQTTKSYISPILDHSGARKRQEINNSDFMPDSYFRNKRRKSEKLGKGLRHFSMKVCEKVRKKGNTSYNEVADELVGEFTNSNMNNPTADQQYDQKNIRRRVYDALNVLMAMNIISKEKKEIRWLGLPTNSLQECAALENEKKKKIERIRAKTQKLNDLLLQQISFKNLVERNREHQKLYGQPTTNSTIQLPFIVVNTNKKTVIDCSISNDKLEYLFEFGNKFEIHDDIEVLKRIGMLMGLDNGSCSEPDLERAKSMLPKSLQDYVVQLAQGAADPIQSILDSVGPGPSGSVHNSMSDDILADSPTMEDMSRMSSISDPLSPAGNDFSDEEQYSDMSSDVEVS